jgi:hypothetical protein
MSRCYAEYYFTFSTTITGRHDIAELLLKVALSTINQIIKSNETMHWPNEKGQKDKQICTKHCTDRVTRYNLFHFEIPYSQ